MPGCRSSSWAEARDRLARAILDPLIGFGRYSNLLVDTGHGHSGWAMACGSGKLAADLPAGRQLEIDVRGLGVPGRNSQNNAGTEAPIDQPRAAEAPPISRTWTPLRTIPVPVTRPLTTPSPKSATAVATSDTASAVPRPHTK